jgi:hypothetical protein
MENFDKKLYNLRAQYNNRWLKLKEACYNGRNTQKIKRLLSLLEIAENKLIQYERRRRQK